jgi:hypothetical protein
MLASAYRNALPAAVIAVIVIAESHIRRYARKQRESLLAVEGIGADVKELYGQHSEYEHNDDDKKLLWCAYYIVRCHKGRCAKA